MTRTKKIIIGTLCIGLIASLAIGGTLSFLTDTEEVTNHFSIGDLDITISEPNWKDEDTPDSPGDGKNLIPGDSRIKDPTITSVVGDSFMRVIVTIRDKDGNAITDKERLDKIIQTIYYADPVLDVENKYSLSQLSTYTTVNSDFTLMEDKSSSDDNITGVYCYNYNLVLKEGESVELFTNIVIPTDWNQTDLKMLGAYQIEIYAQAIQSENFSSSEEAFSALDAEIEAGTLQEDYATVGGITILPDQH